MAGLLNISNCKKAAKDAIAKHKPSWKANRISKEFMENLEIQVRIIIEDRVRRHPSRGKTLTW